jgi:hypothetical protein
MTKHPTRRRDLNQWAKRRVDLATKQAEEKRELSAGATCQLSKSARQVSCV